jgi:hypothetical protein
MAVAKGNVITISRGSTVARINPENGQLFSLVRAGTEVMWKGGAPEGERPASGWQNSEFVMFPIVGSALRGVHIRGATFPVAKHGIARDLPWSMESTPDTVIAVQAYTGGREVQRGKGETSVFPCSYRLTKLYHVAEELRAWGRLIFSVEIRNTSDAVLPYAVGWHPAFAAQNPKESAIEVLDGPLYAPIYSSRLGAVRRAEGNVVIVENSARVTYDTLNFSVMLKHNFGNTQIWHTGEGLVALEPMTAASLSRRGREGPVDILSCPGFRKLAPGMSETFTAEVAVQACRA